MAKRIKMEINGKFFNSKSKVIDFIRGILYKYPIGKPVSIVDFEFLKDLFYNHPNADQKIGVGIKQIIVDNQNKTGNTNHFTIIRHDETRTDISFYSCITVPKPYTKFSSVCRRVIKDQVIQFNHVFFDQNKHPICPISSIELSPLNSHVDHISPNTFSKLINEFISEFNLDLESVEYKQLDNQIGAMFKNRVLIDNFYNFHKNKATLRVVSKNANLSILRKK